MIEFEWEKTEKRAEAAALLRSLADALAGSGEIELEHDGWQLKLPAAQELAIEVELEAGDDETKFELELKWAPKPARGGRAAAGDGGG